MTPSAPGTSVTIRDEALARFAAQDTAAWFVVGFTAKGPVGVPTPVRSLAEFVDLFGDRVAWSELYDALDVFFREGGGVAYVSRVVGPTPVKATANIFDAAGSTVPGDVALTITATDAGSALNSLAFEVTASGGNFEIEVTDGGTVIETSGVLADRAAAVAWGVASRYVDVALGASNEDPRTQGPTSLSGGTDDHTNATEAEWQDALDVISKDYGAGQVSAPGRTTATTQGALAQHAQEHNRVALIDLEDSGVAADLISDVAAIRATDYARNAAAFAPWAVVPGSTPGTTRTVPPSAVVAGLIARSQSLGNSPNVPAAGRNGQAAYVAGLSQEGFSEADRGLLNEAGVNLIREIRGAFRVYGFRTAVDPSAQPEWRELGGARTAMAVAAEAEEVGEDFVFAEIDGQGKKVGEYGGRISAICLDYYAAGALYGATPDEAFYVDTGPTVNTPETLDDGKLLARIELATSPAAERVEITVVKTS